MLIAAAICPHPPLLIPEVSGRSGPGEAELDRLRTACRQAVAALAAERPDLIAVVGGAPRTGEYPPDAAGSLAGFGLPFPGDGPAAGPVLPLSLSIGKWLLARAPESLPPESLPPESPPPESSGPVDPQVTWWGIAADAPAGECLELGEKIAALAPRVALLAMGDGPGRRARGAPGAADAAADRYDDQVAA
ncbi:MAG: hypothetical protein M3Z75_27805, partial [Actinomycetota bacterium]|nr:hypothetical protein [Actinomycetota bacterium]